MSDRPMAIMTVLGAFAPLFSRRIVAYVKLWLVGAILAPGQRTLWGLYAIITLAAAHLIGVQPAPVRVIAWSPKHQATFADAMALVRRFLWCAAPVSIVRAPPEVVKIPRALFERLTETRCYAA